jgi:hypothetical protein
MVLICLATYKLKSVMNYTNSNMGVLGRVVHDRLCKVEENMKFCLANKVCSQVSSIVNGCQLDLS